MNFCFILKPLLFNTIPSHLLHMKKSIYIHISGISFCIDDEAYVLLEKYLNKVRLLLKEKEAGNDVYPALELHIAERFTKNRTQKDGKLTVDEIKDIIKDLGQPAAFISNLSESPHSLHQKIPFAASEDHEQTTDCLSYDPRNLFKKRKFYRHPDDKLLGGVLSGLCCYFGGNDALPWRLIFIMLSLASLPLSIIFYLIVWAIIPTASTPEERLRMKGKTINTTHIEEEIKLQAKLDKNDAAPSWKETLLHEGLNCCIHLLMFCSKILALLITAPIAIGTILAEGFWGWAMMYGFEELVSLRLFKEKWVEVIQLQPMLKWQIGAFLLSAIMFSTPLLYMVIRSLSTHKQSRQYSRSTQHILPVTLITSLLTCIGLSISSVITYKAGAKELTIQQNTFNGIYINKLEKIQLDQRGWEILTFENCNTNGCVYQNANSLTDEDESIFVMRFKKGNNLKPMQVHLKHGEYLPSGLYRAEAIVSSQGPGAYIYAQSGQNEPVVAAIPADDVEGYGNIKNFYVKDSNVLKAPYKNCEWLNMLLPYQAVQWSFVQTKPFYHNDGLIYTGTTNIGSLVHQDELNASCHEFKIYAIKIVPVEEKKPTTR